MRDRDSKESNWPTEDYIELENNPYLLGRITINRIKNDFVVDIDIIYKESHKIFHHVTILYNQPSAEEGLVTGVQELKKYLDSQKVKV